MGVVFAYLVREEWGWRGEVGECMGKEGVGEEGESCGQKSEGREGVGVVVEGKICGTKFVIVPEDVEGLLELMMVYPFPEAFPVVAHLVGSVSVVHRVGFREGGEGGNSRIIRVGCFFLKLGEKP